MPSQLYTNSAISFICARNFLYNGVEYKLGDDFDQELAVGALDLLIRTRRLYAVVDEIADKPRHWHHHVWLRKDITKKLGVLNHPKAKNLTGSSLYNRYKQIGLTFDSPSLDTPGAPDEGRILLDEARANASTEEVLKQENEEGKYSEENQYVDDFPEVEKQDEEPQEEPEEERAVEEEDLFDPAAHGVPAVLDYLTGDITAEEQQRVMDAERAGKARKGILDA